MNKLILVLWMILVFYSDMGEASIEKEHLFFSNLKKTNNFGKYIKHKNIKISSRHVDRIIKKIIQNSKKFKIDPLTILMIMEVESNFTYNAINKNDKGIMQVNEKIWVKDKQNPNNLIKKGIINHKKELLYIGKNIDSGSFILSENRKSCEIWKDRKKLIGRNYKTVNECMIKRYNGKKGHYYYKKVTSSIGDYYFFINS